MPWFNVRTDAFLRNRYKHVACLYRFRGKESFVTEAIFEVWRYPTADLVCSDYWRDDSDDKGSVVLLSDSAHSFPPDIGLGLKAGLEDEGVFIHVMDAEEMKAVYFIHHATMKCCMTGLLKALVCTSVWLPLAVWTDGI